MNRRRSQFRAPGLFALMTVTIALACSPPVVAQGEAAATVNGEVITRQALMDRLLSEFGKSLVDDLIDELIVLQEARRLKIEVTEAEVDKRVEQHKASLPPGIRYEQWLLERKFTRYAFRERMRTIVRLEKIVTPNLKTSDSEASLFVLQHPEIFSEPAKVHLRGIKKMTRPDAEQVRKAALAPGAKFEELAKNYSQDDGTRNLGGDLGWRQTEATEQLLRLKAEKGKISEVVAAEDGYWVYQVLDTQPAKEKRLSVPEKLAQARAMVFEQQLGSALIRYFDELKGKAKIEKNLPEKK